MVFGIASLVQPRPLRLAKGTTSSYRRPALASPARFDSIDLTRRRRRARPVLPAWVVAGIEVFEAERTDGVDLADVLAGLRPVEVPRIAGEHDDAAGRIGLHLVAVELFAEANVEDAGDDRIDAVLRVA